MPSLVATTTTLVLLLGGVISQPIASSSLSNDCDVSIKVMNYNTRQLPRILFLNDWDQDERLNQLLKALRQERYQADVVILNELLTQEATERMQNLKDVYPYITTVVGQDCIGTNLTSLVGPCHPLLPRSGVMALSKFPILETHGLIFSFADMNTWDARANKGAIYLRMNIKGLPVHVVGTHLQADEILVYGGATRLLQMKEILKWLETFSIPIDEPVILAGDINTELGSQEQIEMFSEKLVFHFTPTNIGTFSRSTNWLARADAYNSLQSLYTESHLDYVLTLAHHLQPLKPATMSIVKLKSERPWFWSYLEGWWPLWDGPFYHNGFYQDVSDHYPVVANFNYHSKSCSMQFTNNVER